MCGIVGYIADSDHIPVLERAVETLEHRGPDDSGLWREDGVGLGMRRLSVIDVDGGHQPVWNESKRMVIVFNGEIYNFRQLRAELISLGHDFRTRSDTEVVLQAYQRWGADCLHRLNGMFAFAVWDRQHRELFIARDRVGEKPLYYYYDSHRFAFASEIKAILADRTIRREIDLEGLVNYLTFGHGVAPQTVFRQIKKLPPGHYLTVRGGSVRVVQYWDVASTAIRATDPAPACARTLSRLLDDAVSSRMVADVPVGAFLSGGLDSTAIVALMQRHTGAAVKTFSVGFAADGAYNELAPARQVAMALGTDHHELLIGERDLPAAMEALAYHHDEPFADSASFPLYLLSRVARQHVKVVLTGDGSDELFGGYRRYSADRFASMYARLPLALGTRWLPSLIDRFPRLRRLKRTMRTLPIADAATRYPHWLVLFTPDLLRELLDPAAWSTVAQYDAMASHARPYHQLNGRAASDHLNRLMYVDLKTWLPDAYLEKTDKATMACGLEARLPFLDHRLVEFAFGLPGHYKVRRFGGKWILRQALRGKIPKLALTRPKRGFAVPTDPWLRGTLRAYTFDVLLDRTTRGRRYFNVAAIERLWREHIQGRHVWDEHLWVLLNFELWHRRYLDGAAA